MPRDQMKAVQKVAPKGDPLMLTLTSNNFMPDITPNALVHVKHESFFIIEWSRNEVSAS